MPGLVTYVHARRLRRCVYVEIGWLGSLGVLLLFVSSLFILINIVCGGGSSGTDFAVRECVHLYFIIHRNMRVCVKKKYYKHAQVCVLFSSLIFTISTTLKQPSFLLQCLLLPVRQSKKGRFGHGKDRLECSVL